MIEVFYLKENKAAYGTYSDFEQARLACSLNLADHYNVTRLVYNGHELDYHDTVGNLCFYFSKLDRGLYES